MDTLETLGKLWYLGAAVVAIAAYAVTIKVRVDYLEKHMINKFLNFVSMLT